MNLATTQKHIDFFKQFLKHPARTGAILPSSPSLAAAIVSYIDFSHADCIVEIGVGTGEFTREIIARKRDETLLIGIEANEKFADETAQSCNLPTIYHGYASDIGSFLQLHERKRCDYIVSGLPWAIFDQQEQTELMKTLYDALEPGGKFIAFAYVHALLMPSGTKFQRLLRGTFSHMEISDTVRENIPPAHVYCCTK